MKSEDLQQLLAEVKVVLAADPSATFAIVGLTPAAFDILAGFQAMQAGHRCLGIYDPERGGRADGCKHVSKLAKVGPTAVVLASDEVKESLLEAVLPFASAK